MNTPYAPFISFLGTGTLFVQILIVLGILLYFASLKAKAKSKIGKTAGFIRDNSTGLGLFVAALATISSLFLSEIVHFVPCQLCWYQRIFMYPQVVILGIALWKNDVKVRFTSLVLSVIGLLIAIYHILLQLYPGVFPCSDEVANCALAQFKYFGFITIPVMAGTAFALLVLIMAFGMRKSAK